MVEAGRVRRGGGQVDGIVALGGGSSLDCAKAINFVLTNGGSMRDYRGHGKASKPMLPSIGIPTTAGTGSEAQSFAIISDAETHAKMACGDEKAAFRIVLLDPALTVSQPRSVTAIAGYDALSHAVEAYVTKNRTPQSARLAREAWRLLEPTTSACSRRRRPRGPRRDAARRQPGRRRDRAVDARRHPRLRQSAHREYGTTHGIAIAVMLPHVVRWNAEVVGALYEELLPGKDLAARLEELARAAGLPRTLTEFGASACGYPRAGRGCGDSVDRHA